MKKTASGISGLIIVTLMLLPNYTFSQQISIGPDVKMLALGDSYTIGESVLPEERWPHKFIGELIAAGIKTSTPDYIATTGWIRQTTKTNAFSDLKRSSCLCLNWNL